MPQLVLHFVYGLTDPRLQGMTAVRYIGVSINPNQRYQLHLTCPQHDPIEKNAWVQSVQAEGLEPGIEIFEVFKASKNDKALALARETRWIQYHTHIGAELLNIQKNEASGRRAVTVEVPSDKDSKLSSPGSSITDPIVVAGRVLDNGVIIRKIDFDDLFSLMMQGAIGERD